MKIKVLKGKKVEKEYLCVNPTQKFAKYCCNIFKVKTAAFDR
jgi:hypothetical protein